MSRAAIVATLFTGILAFSPPSLAASDAEIARSGNLMSGAFRCLTYARMFHDYKEEQRLLQIGVKAARNFYEGLQSRNDPSMAEMKPYWVSTDFLVGIQYEAETTEAYDKIVKYDNGIPREHWLDAPTAKNQAEIRYRESNCSLIQ